MDTRVPFDTDWETQRVAGGQGEVYEDRDTRLDRTVAVRCSRSKTLGPYSVTAKLGAGGMGEVWRARDTKLDRDVALKVLPEAFTADLGVSHRSQSGSDPRVASQSDIASPGPCQRL